MRVFTNTPSALIEFLDFKDYLNQYDILNKSNIRVYNLMFDGENLYAIDTCGYRKVKEDTKDVYRHNKYYLDDAIKDIFSKENSK